MHEGEPGGDEEQGGGRAVGYREDLPQSGSGERSGEVPTASAGRDWVGVDLEDVTMAVSIGKSEQSTRTMPSWREARMSWDRLATSDSHSESMTHKLSAKDEPVTYIGMHWGGAWHASEMVQGGAVGWE